MPLVPRWRVGFPRRVAPILMPPPKVVTREGDDEEDSVCRFCWQVQDSEYGGELLAPCRCAGSIKFIHRRCLGAWQRTQRSQGALRKSYKSISALHQSDGFSFCFCKGVIFAKRDIVYVVLRFREQSLSEDVCRPWKKRRRSCTAFWEVLFGKSLWT